MFLRGVFAAVAVAAIALAQDVLNNDSIVKLVKAGMSESVIISMVNQQAGEYSLKVDDLIALKEAGVTDKVVAALVAKGAGSPASSPSQPVVAAGPVAQQAMDVGIYFKKPDGTWADVLPEVVNWKTGGTIKSMATYGVVKKDINGNIPGTSSKNVVKSPVEFLVVAQEGVAITEYQLIRLRPNKKEREFRTMTGGVFNQSSGATRDLVEFEGKRVAPRTFSVVLPDNVTPGEYGFLAPGAFGSSGNTMSQIGKMYTFHLLE